MYARNWWHVAAIAASMGMAGSVFAADAGTTTSQAQSGASAAGSVAGYVPYGPSAVGGSERIDNTNAVPLDQWSREYAQTHGGHLPPVVYVIPDSGHVTYYVPEHAPATYVAPDARVTFVVPQDARVTYAVPADGRVIYVVRDGIVIQDQSGAANAGGGMQATPGADGPGSPKGE